MVAYVPPTNTTQSPQPRRRSYGKLVALLVVIIIAALVVNRLFFSGQPAGGPGAPAGPMPVSAAKVISRDLTSWHRFSGRLEAIDKAEVRARVSGTIERIYFRDGATVRRGQPLFLIDPAPYKAEVARAEGQLAAAEAELATARLNAGRAQKLMNANAIARSEFDVRMGASKSAEGSVKSARGALETARLNLRYTTVTAPINGRASRAELTTGNMVDAGPSAPILTTIVSQSPLFVSFEADEQTFLTSIRGIDGARQAAIPVEMGLANEQGTPHKGRIGSFDNQIDPASGTIRVRAVFDNADGSLIPGLFANVRVGSPETHPALLINEQAIQTDQNSKFVMIVDAEGKAQYRPVKLGGTEGSLRIVTEGITENDTVVTSRLAFLRPETPVTVDPVDMETLAKLNPAPATDTPTAAPGAPESAPEAAAEPAPVKAAE